MSTDNDEKMPRYARAMDDALRVSSIFLSALGIILSIVLLASTRRPAIWIAALVPLVISCLISLLTGSLKRAVQRATGHKPTLGQAGEWLSKGGKLALIDLFMSVWLVSTFIAYNITIQTRAPWFGRSRSFGYGELTAWNSSALGYTMCLHCFFFLLAWSHGELQKPFFHPFSCGRDGAIAITVVCPNCGHGHDGERNMSQQQHTHKTAPTYERRRLSQEDVQYDEDARLLAPDHTERDSDRSSAEWSLASSDWTAATTLAVQQPSVADLASRMIFLQAKSPEKR